MIELTFSDSAAGTLKLAKQSLQGKDPGGFSPLLEGGPEDVLPLTLDLDIGDLSDIGGGMSARRALRARLFAHFPGVADEIMKINDRALARLKEARDRPERIRMWVSGADPSELCGMYFVCHFFSGSPVSLSAVRIPEEFEKSPRLILYRGTGEISIEDFEALSEYDAPLGPLQCALYAQNWRALASENAPLRAVLNGRVIGVPEDFYDFALLKNIPEGEFRTAQLLGKALEQIPGVGDSWLYLRVRAMLEAGVLAEVAPPEDDYPYSGVLRRS